MSFAFQDLIHPTADDKARILDYDQEYQSQSQVFLNSSEIFQDIEFFVKQESDEATQLALLDSFNPFNISNFSDNGTFDFNFVNQDPPTALPPLDFSDVNNSAPASPPDSAIDSPQNAPSPLTQVFNALMASSQVKSEVQHTSVTPAPVSLPVASGGTVPNIANVNRGHGVNNAAQFPGQFYYPNVNGPSPSVMQGAGSPHHQGIPSPHNSSGGQSPAHFVPVTATGHPQTFPIGMDNSFVPQQIANGSLAQHQQQMNFGQAQMQMDPAFANFQSFNGHMHAGSQHSSPEGVHQSASMPLSGNGRPQQPKRYRCPHPGCEKAFARNYNLGTHMSTHTGRKDYVCPSCPKAFSRKHDLGRHLQALHQPSPEKPIVCSGCNGEFHDVPIYQKHKCESTT